MADEGLPTRTDVGQSAALPVQGHDGNVQARAQDNTQATVIWTPTFITLFALTLVVGLSMTTILIQGWLNGHYSDQAVLLAYTPLLFCLWLAVLVNAHTVWVRSGALFGCLWSLFTACKFWLLAVDPQAASTAPADGAAYSALLATFLCLSLAHTPFRIWDSWFFRLLSLPTILILGASSLHSFQAVAALSPGAGTAITLLLCLCSAVWLLRPSCWQSQPGPAFIFGSAPLLLLLFVMPPIVDREQSFFFHQIFLLCILLGAMRILQGERRHRLSAPRH